MNTQFITVEIPVQPSALELQRSILSALQASGEPLRWAITNVQNQTVTVEAVVTCD